MYKQCLEDKWYMYMYVLHRRWMLWSVLPGKLGDNPQVRPWGHLHINISALSPCQLSDICLRVCVMWGEFWQYQQIAQIDFVCEQDAQLLFLFLMNSLCPP